VGFANPEFGRTEIDGQQLSMPTISSKQQADRIRKKYSYLTNYSSDDPTDPIDLLSYLDSNDDALIHIAAALGDVDTVRFLLDAGIEVALTGDMGSTPLHYALSNGAVEVASLLFERGAPTDIKDQFGKTPGELPKVD
jgi:ankyrin repeat protein